VIRVPRATRGAAAGQTATVDSTVDDCGRRWHRRDSASRAPGLRGCSDGKRVRDSGPKGPTEPRPGGREKEGINWRGGAGALGATVTTTIRSSATCRRFYTTEAALGGISLLIVQIYVSTTTQLYDLTFSDTFHCPDLRFHYTAPP